MSKLIRCVALIIGTLLNFTTGDFGCLCNYNVETPVVQSPTVNTTEIGQLYEFDCKPLYQTANTGETISGFTAIHFENKIGYVKTDDQIQEQICPGEPSSADLYTTKRPQTTKSTTTLPTTTSTTNLPTTTSTTTLPTTTSTTNLPTTTSSQTSATTKQQITTTPPTTLQRSTKITALSTSTESTITTTPLSTRTEAKTTTTLTTTSPSTTTKHIPFPTAMNFSGSPLQYIGVGYNLLHGNPDGNQYGATHMDEGFNVNKRILQLTEQQHDVVREVQYKINVTSCVSEKHASILFDEVSYQEQLMESVRPSDTHPSELNEKAFTLSIEYKHLYPVIASDVNIYRDVVTSCSQGFVRYRTEDVPNAKFTVTKEFASAVCQLQPTYNVLPYIKFLETWGTSIVISSQLGRRSITRYHISKLQAFDHVQQYAPDLVHQTNAYLGYASSLSIDTDNYTRTQSTIADVFGTLQSTTTLGTNKDPVPIQTELVPITYALDPNLWKEIKDSGILHDLCPQDFDLSTIADNIMKALKVYAAVMSAPTVKSSPLRIPVTWPAGTYGLMKTNNGCPEGHVMWLDGWRKQDTEDHDAANHFSQDITSYMAGSFGANNLVTQFCLKSQSSTSKYDRAWPPGQYCLLQYKDCPSGFERGSLLWDDEDKHNSNAFGGTLPEGGYDSNTKIFYCCRTDGTASNPISLPTGNPFILLRYGTTCQTVYHMKLKEVFVRWDDQDGGNFDGRWGSHPYDDGGPHDHRLYFCHYHSDDGDVFVPSIVG